MTTHEQFVAAAEKARPSTWAPHVDDLLAILRLHTPMPDGEGDYCRDCHSTLEDGPCRTVQIVVDRLTEWGVL